MTFRGGDFNVGPTQAFGERLRRALDHPDRLTVRREITASGLFDEHHYRLRHGDAVAETGLDPLDHFIFFGHSQGLSPFPSFEPSRYLQNNPDAVIPTANALLHYIRHGDEVGRWPAVGTDLSQAGQDAIQALVARTPVSRHAVVIHVYYDDTWSELSEAIACIPEAFDLYVSLVRGRSDHLHPAIRSAFPDAVIVDFPNHGRDIFPFCTFLSTGVLDRYEFVLKLHGKVSRHRVDGADWRRTLIGSLLGGGQRVARLFSDLRRAPDIGLVAPDGNLGDAGWWGANRSLVRRLAARLNIALSEESLCFPLGSMFWCRPDALSLLRHLDLSADNFDPESGQLDGTLAHGCERLFGIVAEEAGYSVVESGKLADHAVSGRAFHQGDFHVLAKVCLNNDGDVWRRVCSATPLYFGHTQPRLPDPLGFGDWRVAEVRQQHVDLARSHGIDGFILPFLPDSPANLELLEALAADGFPFCLSWQGGNEQVSPKALVSLARLIKWQHYIRLNEKPVVMIEPSPAGRCGLADRIRHGLADLGPLHLIGDGEGFDAGLFDPCGEAPPYTAVLPDLTPAFSGVIANYAEASARAMPNIAPPRHQVIRVGGDTTAQAGNHASILLGANPARFGHWLRTAILEDRAQGRSGLIILDSWNDWLGGSTLHHDPQFGTAYLDRVANVVFQLRKSEP